MQDQVYGVLYGGVRDSRPIGDTALRNAGVVASRLGGRPLVRRPSGSGVLAPREVDVLQLVAVGASNAEIAGELGLTLDTVKSYLRSAMRRLEVRNRAKAVLAARAAGII